MQKTANSLLISHFYVYFYPRQRAIETGWWFSVKCLTIRISRKNAEVRRFPVRNLKNNVIFQTSDKQRKFEISFKVTKPNFFASFLLI